MNVSDKVLPLENLGTNTKELHTQTSTPKKLEENDGDKNKKLDLDRVFYENEALRKADTVFWELLKQKLVFFGKIIKTPGIWHVL
jgi:hypothetical protein